MAQNEGCALGQSGPSGRPESSVLADPSVAAGPSAPTPDDPGAPAAERVELEELRTETSRTYDNGDGTLTDEIAPFPIHYDADGDPETTDWEPIELWLRGGGSDARGHAPDPGDLGCGARCRRGCRQRRPGWLPHALQG